MELIPKNISTTDMQVQYLLLSQLNGTTAIPGGTAVRFFNMANVTSNTFQTLFSVFYRVEDVGFIQILNIEFVCTVTYNGNGSIQWQITGDGGTTWNNVATGAFNVGVVTQNRFFGRGLWLSTINVGNNQLGFRFQALANAGTVATQLRDDANCVIAYRKKVIF